MANPWDKDPDVPSAQSAAQGNPWDKDPEVSAGPGRGGASSPSTDTAPAPPSYWNPTNPTGFNREGGGLDKFIEGATGGLTHPDRMLSGFSSQTGKWLNSGNPEDIPILGPSIAAGHRLLTGKWSGTDLVSVIPGIGPAAVDAGREISEGNPHGFGTAFGMMTPGLIRSAPAITDAATDLVRPSLKIGATKAWRPPTAQSDFSNVVPGAISDVKTFGGKPSGPRTIVDPKTMGNEDLLPSKLNPNSASERAIQSHQAAMDAWLDRGEKAGATVAGDDIVRATLAAIPETMKLESPTAVKSLMDQTTAAYGGKQIPVKVARQYLKEKNAGSSGFYNKSEGAQGTAQTAGTPSALEVAQTNGIREGLYRALDPENEGAGPREIQSRTGAIMDQRKAAEQSRSRILQEKPTTTIGGLWNGPVQAARGVFRGDLSGAASALAHPFVGPTDALINRMYRWAPEASPLPMPGDGPLAVARRSPGIGPANTTGGNPINVNEVSRAQFAPPAPGMRSPGIGPANTTGGNPIIIHGGEFSPRQINEIEQGRLLREALGLRRNQR